MTRSAARSLALGRLALAALGATAAACTDTPARYTEAQFLDLIALPDSDTSDTVPPLECPASDPDCECIVPEHCPAVACTTVTACTDRRCVREAKADCTTCEAARDCTDDGDKCTVEQCSPAGECETKPLACSDDRGCTINACDPQSGCTVEDTCPSPTIELPDSATIDEGPWSQAGTFTGSTLDGETFTGTVDWGDGGAPQSLALANGKFTLNHTYAEPGSFDVAVSINDNFDRKTTVHVALTVEDLAPVVTIGDDVVEVINEGSTFDLHGTVVDPGGNDGLTGSIDFGDGSDPETLTINGSGSFIAPRHRFGEDSDDGTFDIVVSVSDKQSAVGSVDYHLTVRNVAPIVSKPLSPPPCFEGTECRLELALIEPGDDTITGTVNVGTSTAPFSVEQAEDGSKTLVLTLLYPNDGQQSVTYNLRDDDAPALVDSFVVDVRNVAPAIVPHDPVTGREGKVVTTTVTFTDPGADQLEWAATVDYGDGTPVVPAAVNKLARTVALSHTYADDGDYTASVTVSDADANDKADVAFDIGNSDPVPHLGPDQTIAEGAIWLRARVATDDGADSFTGHVSYGGGAPEDVAFDASGAYVLSHLFPQDGSFEVALTVDDEDGGSATESATVTVTNVAPTLACGPAVDVVLEGKPFARGCTVSDPGADALTATVSFGEDGVGAVPVPIVNGAIALAHTFTDKGSYSVVVTVSDDDTSVQKTIVVGVGNVLPLVDAGEPATIDEGSLFESAGVVASAVVGDTLTATVDWGDGGAVEALALDADGHFALSHRYRQDGAFTVTVEATDGDGDQGQGTVLVTVDDVVPTVDAGADVAIDEGGTVARSVTVSDPGLDDVLVATIDAGKGGPSTQVPVAADGTVPLSLVYPQDGSYTVTVSVSDGGPTPGVASFVVTVRNVAPILGALADGSADEGALVSRTVVITDPGADSFLATIDWGDGTVLGPSAVSTSSFPVSHRYADNGSFHVVVTLSDGGATPGTTGFTETVANVAPTLTPGTLVAIDEGSTWSYVGTVADAGTADTFSGEVRWITGLPFVPFSPVRGLNTVTHLFPQDGNFAVTVHVTDDDGATVTSDVTAVVRNVAPAFELGADASVDEGATFTRSVTFTDPGADAWTADVSWDDGTVQTDLPVTQATPFDISHAWRNQGSYVVRLDIYDGQTAPGDDFTVTVKNVAPSVSVGGPTTVAEGGTLIRNGTVSDRGADDVISATVDYGQGAGPLPLTLTNRGFALSHVYPSPGTFTVTVVATDDSGAHGQASFVVTVSDTAPVVDAGDDASLVEGDTLARVVTFADAGSNDWTAMVDWGEGDGPEAAPVDDLRKEVTLSHQYKEDGVYTVLVSVFDGVETGQGSFAVSVDNAAPVVSLGAAASANEGALFTRGGTFTDVGVLDVHSATVSYGDGGAAQPLTLGAGTFTLSHTWADNGIYDVTVALGDGVDVTTQHLQVTVQNVAPTVTAGTLVAVDEGGTWTFVGTIADQGSADTLSGLVRWTRPAPSSRSRPRAAPST
ncbi:MAG: PKD domain-containing protein [Myxococcota bacterium]